VTYYRSLPNLQSLNRLFYLLVACRMRGWQVWRHDVVLGPPISTKVTCTLIRNHSDKTYSSNYIIPAELATTISSYIQSANINAILSYIAGLTSANIKQTACKDPALLAKLKQMKIIHKQATSVRLCSPNTFVAALTKFDLRTVGNDAVRQLAHVKQQNAVATPSQASLRHLQRQREQPIDLQPAEPTEMNLDDLFYPVLQPFPTKMFGPQPYDATIPKK